jgi:hypothetical protein
MSAESVDSQKLDELEERLRLAERVCLLYGWSGSDDTERGRAAMQAWMEWADFVGKEFTSAKAHPELNDEAIAALATIRAAIHTVTIARIRGEES